MLIRVRIRDAVGADFKTTEIRSLHIVEEKDTERLARECARVIRETIRRKVKRQGSTGKLASAFLAAPLREPGIIGWGVGDIEYLDTHVKYWNHVDKGSVSIGANWQHWLPKGRFINERWVEDEDGFWFMPSKPLPAMNYIAETLQIMDALIPRILAER